MAGRQLSTGLRHAGVGLLALLTLSFSLFTNLPPRVFLFEDGRNHAYGLDAYEPSFEGHDDGGSDASP